MSEKIKVMLSTEGTYPFHHGGVSVWCDNLITNLNGNLDFVVYSIMMNPFVTQKFGLPDDTSLIKVPLWGTEEPSEHLDIPFSEVYLSKKRTVDTVIENEFLPLFMDLIQEIISFDKNPEKFGQTLYSLYKYFQTYEYKESFKSEIIFNAYKKFMHEYSTDKGNKLPPPGVYSIVQSLGWIYRFMTVLNTPVPKVNVTHSSAAAFCSIPCVLSKFQDNTSFILTEHGVYLREQYLSLSQRGYTSFLNTFLIRLIHSVVNLSYHYADQVSPVCDYNTRWEKRFGVPGKKIKVIYNGVDKDTFTVKPKEENGRKLTVVSVARIDPSKDIISLLKTADIVRRDIPEVKFIVYGSITVQSYYEECLELKGKLRLGESFVFAGHTDDVAAAYNSGDVIALSSITEAFPYSVVEAMMSGKAVVATDVGGITEALGDCGIIVEPRSEEQLAKGILTLLKNVELRTSMGLEARERALNNFTLQKIQDIYLKSYVKLTISNKNVSNKVNHSADSKKALNDKTSIERQKLLMEKGISLLEYKFYEKAIIKLREAAEEASGSMLVPVILTKVADAYNAMGQYDKALNEISKIEALMQLLLENTA